MVKVLFYSSKEIYDKSSYEGRAEAAVIAYRDGYDYVVLKNTTSQYMPGRVADFTMERILAWAECDEEYKAMENQINA